ncbi:hypothetical protein RJT34_01533 [Clitoria ternatea]|uniref:F-box domain-containing protein n=1 Tax=Clitoria ternatea TaxID=43366 RepID=A0AAN9KI83_CLITE
MNVSEGESEWLPEEVVVEILSWLKVKKLMQVKCVCRSWNKLVSSNLYLIKLHLQKSSRNPHLALTGKPIFTFDSITHFMYWNTNSTFSVHQLFQNPYTLLKKLQMNMPTDEGLRSCRIVGSCNGLLCAYVRIDLERYSFYLCNPATRLIRKGLSFKVERSYINPKFAFGYDDLAATYKVVAFYMKDQVSHVRVWRVGEYYWKKITSPSIAPLFSFQSGVNDGVHLNGTVHWLALRNYSCPFYTWPFSDSKLNQLVIASLHLGNEIYTYLSPPRDLGNEFLLASQILEF